MISDTIYHLEITDNPDDLDLTEHECVQTALHLLRYLRPDHTVPGKDYHQLLGIIEWYQEHKRITPKQHYYLIMTLWEYIDQRQFTPMEML